MARRDAGQYRAGQRRLAPNRLAGRHGCECSGRRNPKRRHRLADDVFAQDRPERGTAVAMPGKRRGTGALELDVTAHAVAIDHLAEKNGASVTELRHEMSRTGGRHKPWRAARLSWARGCRRGFHALRCGELSRIELEMSGEFLVQPHQTGRGDRSGPEAARRIGPADGVTVVECEEIDCLDLCRHDSSSARCLRSARSTTSRAASCVDWRMTGGALIARPQRLNRASSGFSQVEDHIHGLTIYIAHPAVGWTCGSTHQ